MFDQTRVRALIVGAAAAGAVAGTFLGLQEGRTWTHRTEPPSYFESLSNDPSARQAEPPDAFDLPNGLPRVQIPAVFEARFVPAGRARIERNAFVIGYAAQHGGRPRAYAMHLMNKHEVVNDVVAGRPIAVTW